jgi:hypothetical protein
MAARAHGLGPGWDAAYGLMKILRGVFQAGQRRTGRIARIFLTLAGSPITGNGQKRTESTAWVALEIAGPSFANDAGPPSRA